MSPFVNTCSGGCDLIKNLLILLLIFFISCQSDQTGKGHPDSHSKKQTTELPSFVQEILATELTGWELAPSSSWDDTTFRKYQSGTSQIGYFMADLNCDSKPDFAAILKDSAGNFASYLIRSVGEYYTISQLESYGTKEKLHIRLRF